MVVRKVPPHPKDIEIGARLKALRIAAGLSQEKLAEVANITFQQVQKYEKGTNRLSGSRMQQFADALGVPPSTFFGDSKTAVVQIGSFVGLSPSDIALVRTLSGLPPSIKGKIVGIIEAICEAVGITRRAA